MNEAFTEPDPKNPERTRAVLIVHDGRLIAERYAPGITSEMPLIHSLVAELDGGLHGSLLFIVSHPFSRF